MILVIFHLALTFAVISLLAVGGGTAVLTEMQAVLLDQFNISPETFLQAYSLGQLAPGPNMTMVVVLGMQIAGGIGALVVGISFFLPSSVLCVWTGRCWNRIGETPWRRAAQDALEPISIGFMCSGVHAVAKSAIGGPISASLALAACLIVISSRVNPVYVVLGLGGLGVALHQVYPALL